MHLDPPPPIVEKKQNDVIKLMSLTEASKDKLANMSLEEIFNNMYNTLQLHTERFKRDAKRLKDKEINCIESIETLKAIESYSNTILSDYDRGLSKVNQLCDLQHKLIKDLEDIEDDVDTVLRTRNKIIDPIR